MPTTTVNNIPEAVSEIMRQLEDKSNYLHNYQLLESVSDYLNNCEFEPDDLGEQIYNHLAYDLRWEQNEEEFFPMEL
jgi:hypothetical protein